MESTKDLRNGKPSHVHDEDNIVTIAMHPKRTPRANMAPIKTPAAFFAETHKLILNFM